jgi:hypothetical protein
VADRLCLTDNQPTLIVEARRVLGGLDHQAAQAQTVDVDGTDVVTRRLWTTSNLAGFLDWTHLATVVRVQTVREDRRTGELRCEDHHYVTSIAGDALTGDQWLTLVRRRWAVKNECHNLWGQARCVRIHGAKQQRARQWQMGHAPAAAGVEPAGAVPVGDDARRTQAQAAVAAPVARNLDRAAAGDKGGDGRPAPSNLRHELASPGLPARPRPALFHRKCHDLTPRHRWAPAHGQGRAARRRRAIANPGRRRLRPRCARAGADLGCGKSCPDGTEAVDVTVADGKKAVCTYLYPLWGYLPPSRPATDWTVSGDQATVTDTKTGLVWQRIPPATGGNFSAGKYGWQEALKYCDELVLGEADDWRLPTVVELESIVDWGKFSPSADSTVFVVPSANTPTPHHYWTRTAYLPSPSSSAWDVRFNHGVSGSIGIIDPSRVWCVR